MSDLHPEGESALKPGANLRLLASSTVVTRKGSRLADSTWDFTGDAPGLFVFDWAFDVRVRNVVIGNLGDRRYSNLVYPFQEAIAVRWLYKEREDGKNWAPSRAADACRCARDFCLWAAARGISAVSEVDEPSFEAWVKEAASLKDGAGVRSVRDARRLVDTTLLLWRLRSRISATLGFRPLGEFGKDWITDGPETESYQLIPKAVLDHVVGAALRFIEVYAHDIRAARRYLDELVAEWETIYDSSAPVWKKGSKEYSDFDSWVGRRFGSKNRTARKKMPQPAPWNENGFFREDPDTGKPWLDRIETRHKLQVLENSLRTACYIIIAFLTGGRNGDMNDLPLQCAETVPAVDPRFSPQHLIHGTVAKHRGRIPEQVTWNVPKEAIDAAGILAEMLQPWRKRTGTTRLFATQTGKLVQNNIMNYDLKVFLERIEAPYVDGKPFPLSTHMFRVALAQWLAQEPHGEVAGAIHLKQLSTAAFRGYLRNDTQFQSMLAHFEQAAQADHLHTVMTEPVLRGRKGLDVMRARTAEEQASLDAEVRSINYAQAGSEAPNARTIQRLRKSGVPVYKTALTMCVFKGDSAECLKGVPAGQRTRPRTHKCDPHGCANSAITRLQVPAYLEDFEEYGQLLADPGHSSSQRDIYRQEMAMLARLILPFLPTLEAEGGVLDQALIGVGAREASTVSRKRRRAEVADLIARIERAGVRSYAA
ncbi:hypothetical protein [Roseicella sp. DB1501]|uniref:hypothetical protein n=1 Tax=Roseicella sp. DB1501 TaxID=2730925 RepID=UPI001492E6AC|nr:hypothetical protein [Roseicella sp. DB1501]NOG73355.1 hypothetical protein [Roseicella sp. DB1501]